MVRWRSGPSPAHELHLRRLCDQSSSVDLWLLLPFHPSVTDPIEGGYPPHILGRRIAWQTIKKGGDQ